MPYSIYRLTSPSKKVYIGVSKDVHARWVSHKRRARDTEKRHPLYDAIRSYGHMAFSVETLSTHDVLEEALQAEIDQIAIHCATDRSRGYNISPGGGYDCLIGPAIFWQDMRSNPEKYELYRQKLRDAQAARTHNYPHHLVAYNANLSARERWYRVHRACRLSAKARQGSPWPRPAGCLSPEYAKNMSAAVSAAWQNTTPSYKKRWAMLKRKCAFAQWARRTEQQRTDVAVKISKAQREGYAADPSRRLKNREQLVAARGRIDRSTQGPAASKGLKAFWADLKANPEEYARFMAKRTAKMRAACES